MSEPMSVKERIAMMKRKEEEAKAATKTPDPPVRRSSLSSKVETNGTKQIQSPVLPPPAPQQPVCGLIPVPPQISTSNPTQLTENVVEKPVPPPPPSTPTTQDPDGSSTIDPKISIAERMAKLKITSTGGQPPPPPARRSSLPYGAIELNSTTPTSSVADRLIALRSEPPKDPRPAAVGTPPPPPPPPVSASRRFSMPASVSTALLPPPPPPPPQQSTSTSSGPSSSTTTVQPPPPPPRPTVLTTDSSTENATSSQENSETTPPGKLTIAQRMAALKASSAEHTPPPSSSQGTPSSSTGAPGGARRLSVGLAGLGAKINLAALSPNAVRLPISPKREPEAESDGSGKAIPTEGSSGVDGEFKHLSLTRPAVPSVRRKHASTASVRLQPSAWATEEVVRLSVGNSGSTTPSSTAPPSATVTADSAACGILSTSSGDAADPAAALADMPLGPPPATPPPPAPVASNASTTDSLATTTVAESDCLTVDSVAESS